MQQGGFIRQPKIINDPNAAPAAMRADDVDLQAQKDDFIMGYPAMQQSGPRVRSLVEQAMLKAKDSGVKTKGYKEGDKVDILVHNGEMHIPKELVPYIGGGYTTLKKLNQPSKYNSGGFIDKMAASYEEKQPQVQKTAEISEEKEIDEKTTSLEKLHSGLRGVHRNEVLSTLTAPEKGNIDFDMGRSNNLPGIALYGNYGEQTWEKMKEKLSIMVNNYVKKTPNANYENLFNLYASTVKNIKEGVEESNSDIKTELLLDTKFLKNAFKATEIHTKLNVANKQKSGEELNPNVNIMGNSLNFGYPQGTPNLMEKTKKIKKRNTNKIQYSENENANDNWLTILRNAESDTPKLDMNGGGGFGYSGIDHHIEMPDYLSAMVPYIKKVEGYVDEPKKEPVKEELYTIGWGHQLTANQLEDYKTGKLNFNAEDVLRKDLIEADMLAEKVYNKYLKSKKFKEVANDLGLDATGPNYSSLPDTSKKMLVDLAFNLGSRPKLDFGDTDAGLKAYVKFMAAIANNDTSIMLQEYKRYYTDSKGTLQSLDNRNNEFRSTFIDASNDIMGNKKNDPNNLINHLNALENN